MTTQPGTRTKKESSLQTDCINYLESVGAYVIKTHVGSYQAQGEPDVTCCYLGRYLAFEIKVEGEKPIALQEYKMGLINKAGGVALSVTNINQIKEVLHEISRIQQACKSKRY